jgi:hypothetical protein
MLSLTAVVAAASGTFRRNPNAPVRETHRTRHERPRRGCCLAGSARRRGWYRARGETFDFYECLARRFSGMEDGDVGRAVD